MNMIIRLRPCFSVIFFLVLAVGFLLPGHARAASIYLNGVNIDGVTNQRFDNCTVTVDAQGNIFISAKGYAVQTVGGQAPAAPAPAAPVAPVMAPTAGPVAMHYWLVTEKSAPGMVQYDIDLYINNQFVRKLPDSEGQVVMDISKYLVKGPNRVYLLCKKNLEGGRRSQSPQHYTRVIIGEGSTADGQNVFIDKQVLDYKRTAAEIQDFQDLLSVNAQ
jgi:hypothetical protein